ncbi:GNAT family N-acetyltransferase [Streptomyces griseosporeus]|uniref:GNAT family N-acetyltransferase n=1 Tax=Streptomyces griseosporeus TaxID=1910 RepID=UPI0036CFB518
MTTGLSGERALGPATGIPVEGPAGPRRDASTPDVTPARPALVRPATHADIDELIRLRAHLLEDTASAGLPYAATSAAERSAWRARYRAWLGERLGRDSAVRVAVVPGPRRLRACATAVIDQRAPSPACPGGLAGWIQSVVTDPRDRGQGLGAAVLDDLTTWLASRGVDEVVLQTTATAHGFYRRAGFLPTGEDLLHKPLRPHKEATPA